MYEYIYLIPWKFTLHLDITLDENIELIFYNIASFISPNNSISELQMRYTWALKHLKYTLILH